MLPEIDIKRKTLLQWVLGGLAAVDPVECVAAVTKERRGEMAVLALGKAAGSMARGADKGLGAQICQGLAIAPAGYSVASGKQWQVYTGAHPVPDACSIEAGEGIRRWLEQLPDRMPLLVLLSGGSSAAAELPVDGLSLADLRLINTWLLGSGLDISTINAIRARFSRLKRGGLLHLAGERAVSGLVISDVPGDAFVDIGSGPLSPTPPHWPQHIALPDWLTALHERLPLPDIPPIHPHPHLELIASNSSMLDAVARAPQNVRIVQRGTLRGDAAEAGRMIGVHVLNGAPGLYLYGGETTVRLPGNAGRGGRNQHLALAASEVLAGHDNVLLLALATDGVDGNGEDAGALVDGSSWQRIHAAGLNARNCLGSADSNTALAAVGDVIHTGPTGTNVMDVVIAWKWQ